MIDTGHVVLALILTAVLIAGELYRHALAGKIERQQDVLNRVSRARDVLQEECRSLKIQRIEIARALREVGLGRDMFPPEEKT